jgi:4-oxalocrotonate tautomerase
MPYINVRVAGKLTGDQKRQIVSRMTQIMEEVAGKPPSATYITIDELSRQNWAKSGKLLEDPED